MSAGQALGRLEPRLADGGDDRATLAAAVAEAQAALDGAKAEQARAERLLAERAVPARRVEDARRAVAVAEARLSAAQARLAQRDEVLRSGGGAASGNAFVLRAPIAGRVAEVYAALGASYDEGAPLFRIVRTDRVELQAQVPPAKRALARDLAALALEIPGPRRPARAQARSRARRRRHRPEDARAAAADRGGQPRRAAAGRSDRARPSSTPAAPSACRSCRSDAVLMEAGRPYVFVQIGGERFARRFVEVAARDGDLVGLRSGVMPGERVVTAGAYDIQLASAAKGLPAEGHVH